MISVPPFLVVLIGAPLVLLLRGRTRQIGLITVAGAALVITLLLPTGVSWTVPFMESSLVLLNVDALSKFTGIIFALITFLAVLYAAVFARPWIHLFAMLYAGASLGVVFAGDWISVLIFWEVMALTSTALIWEAGGEAVRAGDRYLLFHGFGGAMLASGVALLYVGNADPAFGIVTGFWPSLFLLVGIGVNAAFIPVHTWLPDAYPRAHIAASVFLSVYTTKAAVYLLARASPPSELVAWMGGIMAVYGVGFAVLQTNMRRLLSYHIVSQVGYMVAGVGLYAAFASDLGLDGGMAHVFNHILYKALLFMVIGVVIWRTGQETLDRLGGLQRRMPVTALAYWIAAFSISGVPGFNGYVSKGMVLAAAEAHSLGLWILLEVASFGTFLSFLKLGYFTFLRPGDADGTDPPAPMSAAMLATAGLCVAIGVYPAILFGILPVATDYAAYEPIRLLETLGVLGAAAALFAAVGRTWLAPHAPRLRDADVVYVALGRALTALAARMEGAFRGVYAGAVASARGLFAAGRGAARLEGRDLNWNLVAYGGALVVVLGILALEVLRWP